MVGAIGWAIGATFVVMGFLATIDACWDIAERLNKLLLKLAYKAMRGVKPAYPVKYRHNPIDSYKAEGPDSLV